MVWTPHLTDIVSYSYNVNQKGAYIMNKPSTICIDLAKNVVQVALFNQHGKLKSNRNMSQAKWSHL